MIEQCSNTLDLVVSLALDTSNPSFREFDLDPIQFVIQELGWLEESGIRVIDVHLAGT